MTKGRIGAPGQSVKRTPNLLTILSWAPAHPPVTKNLNNFGAERPESLTKRSSWTNILGY